ncbi:unnamed protein product, partial [marine sediment metagenome]
MPQPQDNPFVLGEPATEEPIQAATLNSPFELGPPIEVEPEGVDWKGHIAEVGKQVA